MLARLLRRIYLVQLLLGGLLGNWAAARFTPQWDAAALVLIPSSAVAWVIFWQAVIIGSAMLLSRQPGPIGPWLKAVWGELMAALLIFGLRLPWTRVHPGVLPPTQASQGLLPVLPVLLVHGFVCNHRVWDTVVPRLQAQGHSVLALDLEPLFTSIDDYAPLLEQATTQLCNATGSRQVLLVGHSMGGLAIRAWLRANGDAKAAKIITLGTPHHGTKAPQWISLPNGAQMAWGSQWLTNLTQSETPALRQRMRLAFTQHDNIVYPQAKQLLPGAQATEFEGIGHLQMCLDEAVIDWLLGELAGE